MIGSIRLAVNARRAANYLCLLGYAFIAQMSVAMSATTEIPETIDSANKAAPVLIFGLTSSAWDKALIASLIVAAIAAVAVGFSTAASIIAHQQETIAADASLDDYKTVAAGKIAEARTAGIEGGKAAGNAEVRAGEASERAARLEKEAAEARERAAINERTVAELNIQLENIKKPRSIPPDREEGLFRICLMSGTKDFDISFFNGDNEALFLSQALEYIFQQAGWRQQNWDGGDIVLRRDDKPLIGFNLEQGIVILYAEEEKELFEKTASDIAENLRSSGIAAVTKVETWKGRNEGGIGLSKGRLHFVVGKKPL